jgi:hypothetical protein
MSCSKRPEFPIKGPSRSTAELGREKPDPDKPGPAVVVKKDGQNTTGVPDSGKPASMEVPGKTDTPVPGKTDTPVPGTKDPVVTPDPHKKLEVKVDGRRLLVDGKPFHMKGVCWNPVAKGKGLDDGPLFFNPKEDDLKAIERDLKMMVEAGINTVRTYWVIENAAVLSMLDNYGIFVIVPVSNVHNTSMENVKRVVNRLKGERSTLMWQVGNEWNYNHLYGAADFEAAKQIVLKTGSTIKSVDTSIPLSTDWGGMVDPDLVREFGDFDIWGINIYEGKSFNGLFEKYAKVTGKPLFIGEFGVDAFNRKINGEDPAAQAVGTEQLIRELDANLSADSPDKAAIGGALFEWNDEWWKDSHGKPDVQDTGGFAPGGGPFPDGEFNEEWWGIVDIDRKPRPAYNVLKAAWKK